MRDQDRHPGSVIAGSPAERDGARNDIFLCAPFRCPRHRVPMITATLLASLLLASAPAAAPPFSPGEKLHYKGYVLGWLPVGDVWFEVKKGTHAGKEVYRFDARAFGSYLIYTLDIRMTSLVDPETLKSVEFRRREVGTEKRDNRVLFDRDTSKGTFLRKKGRFSSVAQMDAAPWERRAVFPIHDEVNDILYTLYFARGIGDAVGTRKNYWFVENRDVWKTVVTVAGEQKLPLGKLGTFDTLKITIEPDYSKDENTGNKFSGLFGVQGTLNVLVDKKTRIPLIVSGELPFGIFRLSVSVVLQDRSLSGTPR